MGEALGGAGPLLGYQVQHGQQEGAEGDGLLLGPLVLLHQHLEQTPGFQLCDVAELSWTDGSRTGVTWGRTGAFAYVKESRDSSVTRVPWSDQV